MKKKPIPPLIKHKNCLMDVIACTTGPHAGYYKCKKHNKFVAWVSKTDMQKLKEIK